MLLGTDDVNAAPVEELSKSDVQTMLNVEDGANAYSLPTADANTKGGIKVGDRLTIANDVLSADLPAVATTSADGLMSSGDKTKLDGVATGAEVNVQSDWNATSGDAFIDNKPNVQYTSAIPDATASQTGLATSTQITKLDALPNAGTLYDNVLKMTTAPISTQLRCIQYKAQVVSVLHTAHATNDSFLAKQVTYFFSTK